MKPRRPRPLPPLVGTPKNHGKRASCLLNETAGDPAGFSLIEVIIAVGVFAVAATTVLGLLPVLARNAAESADALIAQRLPASLEAELRRAAAATSLDAVASSIPIATTALENGALFVASRDGTRLVPAAESADLVAAGDGCFLIEVWRFPSAPLAYVAGGAVLAVRARVSWPYRPAGSAAATPFHERSQSGVNLAINR